MNNKVLITSGVFPPDIGGPSRMIEQLASDLKKAEDFKGANFDIKIVTLTENDNINRGYPVFRVDSKIGFARKLWKIRKDFDVIYTFDLYTAGFFSWLIGKIFLRKKLVVRFAGDSAWELAYNRGQIKDDVITFQKKFYGFSVALHKLLRKWILRGADRVIAVSEYLKKAAEGIGVNEGKISVIYNSVDFLHYPLLDSQQLRNRYDLNGCKVVLTIGRLVPWKGVDLSIKALSKINDEKLKLLIVGEGPDEERLKKIVQDESMSKRVYFAGKVSLDEVIRYYQLADIFVLDSQYEGLSHVLLEALLNYKPIIASRSGGNPEVIEDGVNGLLVDYGDAKQLTEAIKKMLTEEKWHSDESIKNSSESLKKFSWKNVVEKTAAILNDLSKHE